MIRRLTRANHRTTEGGFTLIELLVVIVILAILAGVVVYSVTGIDDKGEESAREMDARTLATAEEAYWAQHGSYATEQQLVTAGLLSGESAIHDIALDVNGRFVLGCQSGNCGTAGRYDVLRLPAGTQNGFPTPFATQRGPGAVNMMYHFDALMWKDATGLPIPWLAAAQPSVSPDYLTWRFTLRSNVKFTDGQVLDADDVVFTFNYLKTGAGKGTNLYNSNYDRVTAVKESATVVRFDLSSPLATFMTAIAMKTPIIPEHIWAGVANPSTYGTASDPQRATTAALAMTGSGPYKLSNPAGYNPANGVGEWVANADYFLGTPYVRKLQFVTSADNLADLKLGNLDGASPSNDEVVTDATLNSMAGFARMEARGEWNRALQINHTRGFPWNNVKFRQALAYAIDRQDLVTRILGGKGEPGSMGDLAPSSEWTKPGLPTYAHDEAKAEALLDEIDLKDHDADGWRDLPGTDTRFQPTIYSSDRFTTDTATLIMEYLRDVGIDAVRTGSVVVETSTTADARLKSGNFEFGLAGYAALAADPDQLRTRLSHNYTSIAANQAFSSIFGWNNTANATEFMTLADEQLVTMDPAARKEKVHRMQELVAADVPIISLYAPTRYWFYPSSASAFSAWYFTPGGTPMGPPGANSNKHLYVTGRQFGIGAGLA